MTDYTGSLWESKLPYACAFSFLCRCHYIFRDLSARESVAFLRQPETRYSSRLSDCQADHAQLAALADSVCFNSSKIKKFLVSKNIRVTYLDGEQWQGLIHSFGVNTIDPVCCCVLLEHYAEISARTLQIVNDSTYGSDDAEIKYLSTSIAIWESVSLMVKKLIV